MFVLDAKPQNANESNEILSHLKKIQIHVFVQS